MSVRTIGLIAALTLAVLLTSCNGTENYNNSNVNNSNANRANANVANSNLNSNANATPSPASETGRAPTREEYERNKERYQREAKESGRTVGSGLNDGWLWVKTRFDLAAADDLRDSTINVDVSNATVTLTGTVASAAQRTKAEQVAKSVEGVKAVKNALKVAPSGNNNSNSNANANRNGNRNR
jgi:osmotically-inducible protein OsmY